jgi:hypothetical protein
LEVIEKEQLNNALTRIGEYEAFGPPVHEWMAEQGVDFADLMECSMDHADMMVTMGFAPPDGRGVISIAFMAGFSLAVQAIDTERKRNGNA